MRRMTKMVAESSEDAELKSVGEAELTLEGGDCRVTVRGPERVGDNTEWTKALLSGFDIWKQMVATVHAARLEEIRAEQSGRLGPASAGFTTEGMHERRNETLPGGSGVRPV
jgi:hypothetical protein